jgi:hypothetical protein
MMVVKKGKVETVKKVVESRREVYFLRGLLVFFVLFVCAVIGVVLVSIDMLNNVTAHVDGLKQQVSQNRADLDLLLDHYPQFVDLTYNTFNGMFQVQQNHEFRLLQLENSTGFD